MTRKELTILEPWQFKEGTMAAILLQVAQQSDDTLRVAVPAPGTNPKFAVVLLPGENTLKTLEAMIDAGGGLVEASSPADQVERIRGVMRQYFAPVGISKHEAISKIAAVLAEPGAGDLGTLGKGVRGEAS